MANNLDDRLNRASACEGRRKSAQTDSGTSHRDASVALGVARSCLARSFAKRKLRWPGQIDVRLFKRAAGDGTKTRCRKTGERKNRRGRAGFVDGNSVRRSETAKRH